MSTKLWQLAKTVMELVKPLAPWNMGVCRTRKTAQPAVEMGESPALCAMELVSQRILTRMSSTHK